MHSQIEQLEVRTLCSQVPVGANLVWTREPLNLVAGRRETAIFVRLEDADGKTVLSPRTRVTFDVATGPAGEERTLGTAVLVHGVATLPAFSLTVVGTYTLNATVSGLSAVSSKSFDIVAGPAQA